MYLTVQSLSSIFPSFQELVEPSGAHLPEIEEHTKKSRIFRNYAGEMQKCVAGLQEKRSRRGGMG